MTVSIRTQAANRTLGRLFDRLRTNLPHYVMLVDAEGIIIEVNDVAEQVFGDKVVGQELEHVLPNLTRERIMKIPVNSYKSIAKAGHDESSHVTLYKTEANETVVFEECYSQRLGSCQAMARNTVVLRNILGSIPQHVFWKDRKSVYLGCNDNFARVAGLEAADDIVGKTDYDLAWSRQESDSYREYDRRVMESGVPVVNLEEPQTRSDGTVATVLTSKVPLKDAQGDTIGILGVYADITELKEAEQKVRESEERYDELFRSVREGIAILDEHDKVQFCNPSFARMLEHDRPEELIGRQVIELLEPDQQDILRHHMSLRKAGASTQYELKFRKANGEFRCFLITATPRFSADNVYTGTFAALLDMTDRKQAELALQNNYVLLDTLLNTIPNPVYYVNTEGMCIGCNAAFAESVIGKTRDFIIGKDLAVVNADLGRFDLEMADYPTGMQIECTLTFADGQQHDTVLAGAPFVDSNGSRAGSVAVINDVSDFKRVQSALRDTVRVFTTMIDTVPAAMYIKSTDGQYVTVNDGLCWLTNREKEQIVGRSDDALFDSDTAALFREQDQYVIKNGCSVEQAETSVLLEDGNRHWFVTTKVPLYDDDRKLSGIAGITQDVTEARLAREKLIQSDKLAAIGTLAAGVAHEINNPIGFIKSNLNTMNKYLDKVRAFIEKGSAEGGPDRETIDEICADFQDAINESIEGTIRVRNIVADLKSFSRVDKAEQGYANINEGIESTLNIVWNELKYKCTVEKDYGDLPELYCVPNQLNQVFMNLLVNASHAIEETGTIRIRTWADEKGIWVSIKDSGKGIPKELQRKIFEPFFTTKEVGKGTGLGLSLAFDIIKKHNGTIEVESEQGKGAEFIINLPVERTADNV